MSVLPIHLDGADGIELEPCSVVPAEAVIDGNPQEQGAIVFESSDKKMIVGVWECTPYAETFDGSGDDEFCHVISGEVTLTDERGNANTFTAGDNYVVPRGFRGTFRVDETLLKIYVIHMR